MPETHTQITDTGNGHGSKKQEVCYKNPEEGKKADLIYVAF